ncbi:phage major capsid protein [Streptomyces sp. R302]|uniref:phage major capsid protein n=1 Tax=unclassified Streptomyces TaxID=2593676 RepID=UPI00145FBA93|nr:MULTISPECIES: phage major capsid protein [unclassified Streptomyces]NML55169.1 phage major capsid protein [Streptomyces sp. R301]NML83801.1 phage major capsid protein [Streptomyces sp. R302]
MPTETTDRIKELQKALQTKSAEAETISQTFKVEDGGQFVVSPEQAAAFRKVSAEAKEIKSLIDAEQGLTEIKQYLEAPERPPAAATHYGQTPGIEEKSLGDLFVESGSYQRATQSEFRDKPYIRADIEGKSIFSLSAGSVTHQVLGSAQNLGIAERPFRKMHVRDLFPKSTTKNAVLYGARETGWTNAARQVKERYAADGTSPATGADTDTWGRAPRSKLTLTPTLYPVAEISHLLDAHKNVLSDEPRLKTFINTRMVEGVKYAEDWDLLHSVGDGQSLTGIYNTPGVQQYTGFASDQYSVQIRRAITKALLAEYDPTGIVLSPTMWEHVEVEEDKNGAFRVAIAVAIGAEKKVWRLNVVETTAMADSDFLIGAFGLGAQLHDRENVSVTVSSENAENYEKGLITFRADERLALEIPRPESFVIGKWTTPAP